MKKKLGVIGGLGTDTAAQFYIDAERLWHAAGEPNHIPLMIENIQSPFALEQSLVKGMDRVDELRAFLCHAAQTLEHAGATLIVLPCNTAHVHLQAVREAIHVPMLSITEEMAKKLQQEHIRSVTILGTRITRESKIYDQDCLALEIKTIYPTEKEQLMIEQIIQRALSWKNDASDTQTLLDVITTVFQEGAGGVVLACTDLQLCMPPEFPNHVFDSMRTLAEASVKELLK